MFKVHPNALCQGWAQPSCGNGDLQCPTVHDGWRDEIALIGRVDNIDPDVAPAGSFTYRSIHRVLVRCPNDQSTPCHIILTKWTRLVLNGTPRGERRQGHRDPRADYQDQRPRIEKPLDFTGGNFAATDDQAAFPFYVHEHRIVAWHVFVLPLSINLVARVGVAGAHQPRHDSKSR